MTREKRGETSPNGTDSDNVGVIEQGILDRIEEGTLRVKGTPLSSLNYREGLVSKHGVLVDILDRINEKYLVEMATREEGNLETEVQFPGARKYIGELKLWMRNYLKKTHNLHSRLPKTGELIVEFINDRELRLNSRRWNKISKYVDMENGKISPDEYGTYFDRYNRLIRYNLWAESKRKKQYPVNYTSLTDEKIQDVVDNRLSTLDEFNGE